MKHLLPRLRSLSARAVLLTAAGALLITACGPKKKAVTPAAQDYANYVKAYTGGIVTDDAPIRIELAEDALEQPSEGLFSFKPAVKGSVQWNNTQSVSFVPEEGQLRPGLVYQVTFALNKVLPDAPAQFPFSITVKGRQDAEASVEQEPDNGQPFRVVSVNLQGDCIDLELSQAPSNATNKGMIELSGVSRSYVQVQDNNVKVHFEGRKGDMTLTLDSGLKSVEGNALGESFRKVYAEEEEKPAVEIPIKGSILPDKQAVVLPFRAVNLDAVELRIIKIYENNILMYLQDNDLGGDNSLRRSGRLVYKGDIPLDSSKDLHQWNTHSVDLSGLFKQEPGAIYRVRISFREDQSLWGGKQPRQVLQSPSGKPSKADEAIWDQPDSYYWESYIDWEAYDWQETEDPSKPSYYMESSRFPAIQLMSSDIGLLAEYSGGKNLWVAATDLITAKPLSGASLEVFDYQLQSIGKGKTGSNGLATLEVSRKPFAVVAKAGGSTSYLKVTSGNERSLSRFDVGGEVLQQGVKAFIYGERGVWRPGDTLHVTALVADRSKNLPAAHPATLEVYTPEGQFYSKLTRKGVDGFYQYDIPTKADDPTGYWNAYLKVGGSSFHKTLHVETVKPNRLKIQTSLSDLPLLQAGQAIKVYNSATWLSGGPASNFPVRAQITIRKAGGSPFKDFEKYSFYQPQSQFSSMEEELFSGRLDGNGELNAQFQLPETDQAPGMLQAFVVTSVEEPGGDESFTTQTLPYSPYSAYVGIRVPEGNYLETDKEHSFQIAVVGPDGKRLSGHKVDYIVFKTGWNWWLDSAGEDLAAYVNGSNVQQVKSGTLTPGKADAMFTFKEAYPGWGNYLVLARDRQSGHVSGATFTVDWPDYAGRAGRRDPEALTMLSFSTDKPSYRVGDKATVYIPAAPGGQALVSVENAGGVLFREWVSTSDKDTPWQFTIGEEMAPNVYVHLTLVQPYGAVKNDLPLRLFGVQKVKVENPGSHLEPVVQLPDVIHPEEPFLVKVSEKNGKPMTYTLAIVDEGLLDLTAFKTPDPWSKMYRDEALGVTTWDLYDQVIGAYGGVLSPLAAIGGDEDALRSARKDNRFNPVVLFRAPKTLEKGTDILKLQLPMYVGSVRLMLIAGHEGAYGNAEKTVPVQNPLMVVTTLPRVLGCGEETSAVVNVFAMEKGLGQASVTVKADGPLSGGGTQTLKLDSEGGALRFPLKASDAEGVAHVTISASGGGHKAGETIALEVINPNPSITSVQRLTLEKGAAKEVKGNTLQLAAFPAVDLRQMFLQMKNYPYNCGEQLSARGITFLNLLPLLPEADAADAKALIPDLINKLYSRQSADGGFAYWEGGKSDTWVSSMAGLFLTQAAKAGYEVNAGVLKRWRDYQKKMSQVFRVAGDNFFPQLDEAFRLYVQAVDGNANLSGMNRLKEAASLGQQARWMLSSAYALSGKASLAQTLLDGAAREFPEYEPDMLTYGTSTRDLALAVEAMALNGRMADAIALAQDMPSRIYSTQETAFTALALGRLAGKSGQAVHAKVGSADIASAASMVAVPLTGSVQVQNLSDGPLYATVLSESREGARTAAANGLQLAVSYFDEKGAPVNPASLEQGTRFTARLKVTGHATRSFANLALSMGIPSGWEILNERLLGGASEDGYDHKDIRDNRVDWFFGLPAGRSKTFTVQLRAAYPGTYVLPAAVCENMYDPAVNACTATGKAVVAAR